MSTYGGAMIEDFWEQVTQLKTADCWPWNGKHDEDGRPIFDGEKAYRVAYQLRYKDLRSGYHVHHKCENSSCVNPRHLIQLAPEEHIAAHQALRRDDKETPTNYPDNMRWNDYVERERHLMEERRKLRPLPTMSSQITPTKIEQRERLENNKTVRWNDRVREQVRERNAREEAEYRAWCMQEYARTQAYSI
jgi:hypothetical protein